VYDGGKHVLGGDECLPEDLRPVWHKKRSIQPEEQGGCAR